MSASSDVTEPADTGAVEDDTSDGTGEDGADEDEDSEADGDGDADAVSVAVAGSVLAASLVPEVDVLGDEGTGVPVEDVSAHAVEGRNATARAIPATASTMRT